MNIYAVVEGAVGEKEVYRSWISMVNPDLRYANRIADVTQDHFCIISGGGYPNYFDVIRDAVEDVAANQQFDRLVIGIDSEDMSEEEKRAEVVDLVEAMNTAIDYRVVVQHFCLETWGLGNKVIVSRNPTNKTLREYLRYYNVAELDPALLPALPERDLNRAQWSEKYLRLLLNEKYRNLSYSKSNPKVLLHPRYFARVRDRYQTTGHIASFSSFLTAFI